MKKTLIVVFGVGFIIVGVIAGLLYTKPVVTNEEEGYLRFHVRANSNNEADQNVKYKVKDALVDFLTPKLIEAKTIENAKVLVNGLQEELENVADNVLLENGFNYKSRVKLSDEFFPTRSYYELTLESGIYDALIVELGTGTGDNWWCVVYPPLCFIKQENSTTNTVIYRSKLVEIWKKYVSR